MKQLLTIGPSWAVSLCSKSVAHYTTGLRVFAAVPDAVSELLHPSVLQISGNNLYDELSVLLHIN